MVIDQLRGLLPYRKKQTKEKAAVLDMALDSMRRNLVFHDHDKFDVKERQS